MHNGDGRRFRKEIMKRGRQRIGLSQADLAQVTGLSEATIQRIETGKHTPHLRNIRKLAKALGLTPEDLQEWDIFAA